MKSINVSVVIALISSCVICFVYGAPGSQGLHKLVKHKHHPPTALHMHKHLMNKLKLITPITHHASHIKPQTKEHARPKRSMMMGGGGCGMMGGCGGGCPPPMMMMGGCGGGGGGGGKMMMMKMIPAQLMQLASGLMGSLGMSMMGGGD